MIHGLILKAGWEILHYFTHGVSAWVHAVEPGGQHVFVQLDTICEHWDSDDNRTAESAGE